MRVPGPVLVLLAAVAGAVTVWQAVILGIVEGLTEYLPISSTGHLILAQRALGIPASPAANAFAICIQAGAIAAVFLLYRGRVVAMTRGLLGRDETGHRLAMAVGTAFIPAAIFGLLLDRWIEEHLFGLWPVALAWLVGGTAILLVSWFKPSKTRRSAPLEAITPKMAIWVGLAQCLALWPGTSRSLVTIVGGVLVGLSLPAAVEFSFLLGLVTLGAATAYKAVGSGPLLVEAYGVAPLVAGFLAATISAALAVKWLVAWVSRHGLSVFGWYRVLLAVVVMVLLFTGVL